MNFEKMEFMFIAVLYGTRITYDVTKTSSTILKVFDNHDEKNMTLYLTRNIFYNNEVT